MCLDLGSKRPLESKLRPRAKNRPPDGETGGRTWRSRYERECETYRSAKAQAQDNVVVPFRGVTTLFHPGIPSTLKIARNAISSDEK